MISESERREVAARLRFFARETNGTRDFAMFLNHWIGVGNANVDGQFSVKSNRRTAEMTLEKLADLIDPTCHVVTTGEWRGRPIGSACSVCHAPLYPSTAWAHGMRYCPQCGARVVD